MAIAALPAINTPLIPIVLAYDPQVTVDVADAAVKRAVPFPFTVVGVAASCVFLWVFWKLIP